MRKRILILFTAIYINGQSFGQLSVTRDDNGNVLAEAYPSGFYINYQYDVNGNRIGQTVAGNLLPVTLIEFAAIKQPKDVQLKWSTIQEINTDKFIVEFSKDGISFTPFDAVLAKGNSSVRSDYSTIHCCPVNGVNYYRLKILDKDGKIAYSQVRAVVFSESPKFKIYPNPVTGTELSLSFDRKVTEAIDVVIYGINGNASITKKFIGANTLYVVNVSYLSAGTYQIVARIGNEVLGGTFIKH